MSLFVTLCVKIDPGIYKGMHLVLALKLGVTLPRARFWEWVWAPSSCAVASPSR
jgi:hypothetical protein